MVVNQEKPRMVYNWTRNIQALLYPPRCTLCDGDGAEDLDLCAGCRADLPRLRHACARCAAALPRSAAVDLCPDCLRRPPPFTAAHAPLHYAPPADWLIVQLKFHRRLSHARLLGALLASHTADSERPEALIPMPLHRRRWRERGYNQAAEIAIETGRRLGVPVWRNAARRIRATAPQTELPAAKRRANVRGAFAAASLVADRHVAIVDDVATTGHTAAELARTLLTAGARRVDLYCAARA
jgi:ComF family protein